MPKQVLMMSDKNRIAHVLQWGFESERPAEAVEGVSCRSLLQTACIKLPPLVTGNTEVGFYLYARPKCSITIKISSSEHFIQLDGSKWEWHTISVPEADRDTEIFFITPFGKLDGWARIKHVFLGGISFFSESGTGWRKFFAIFGTPKNSNATRSYAPAYARGSSAEKW